MRRRFAPFRLAPFCLALILAAPGWAGAQSVQRDDIDHAFRAVGEASKPILPAENPAAPATARQPARDAAPRSTGGEPALRPFAESPTRREEGRAFSDQRFPIGRAVHLAMVRRLAQEAGAPPDLADAVAAIETGYDPHAVGDVDAIGMMQVRPAAARALGHEGGAQALFDPAINARYGTLHLAAAWRRAAGDVCLALAKYRNGLDEARISPLSIEACRRARTHLAAQGSPMAATIRVPAAPRPSGVDAASADQMDPAEAAALATGAAGAAVAARAGVRRFAGGRVSGDLRQLPRGSRVRQMEMAEDQRRRAASRRFNWRDHAARIRQIEARLNRTPQRIIRD